MIGYINLTFNDLKEEKQEEIIELVKRDVQKEVSIDEADEAGMDYEDLLAEKVEEKLQELNSQDAFIFNI